MQQKKISDILYVFDTTPYQITEDTDAEIIKVQEESYPGFVELNESLADKFVKYNYKVICVTQQEWMPYINQPDPVSPELAWSAESATVTIGADDNVFPTLSNPHDVEVTYSSSDTEKATIDETTGEITLAAAGNAIISAVFAGNDTYKAQTVNYTLTVEEVVPKQDPELAWSANSATVTIGEASSEWNLPTLSNPNNVEVTYNSSNTTVATIDNDGEITLVSAGNATISAIFEGDETYNASTVSYDLTVEDGNGESGSSGDQ